MPSETLDPTNVLSPSAGGSACSGNDDSRTCVATSECGEGLKKASADHRGFPDGTYEAFWTSVTLYVSWRIETQVVAERDCENGPSNKGEMILQYSTNGGSGWSSFSGFPKGGASTTQSGTVSVSLSTSQDMGDMRVRINCQADGVACATGACCTNTRLCDCAVMAEADCQSPWIYNGDGTDCNTLWCDFPQCSDSP